MTGFKSRLLPLKLFYRETRDAADTKQRFLDQAESFQSKCEKFEKQIIDINKEINSVEDDLDHSLTEYKEHQEKLEVAQKESREAELQASALRRRLALAEEEKVGCEERTLQAQQKLVSNSMIITADFRPTNGQLLTISFLRMLSTE